MSDAGKPRFGLLFAIIAVLVMVVGCAARPAAPDTGAAPAESGEAAAEESGEPTRLVLAQTVDLDGLEPSEVNSRAEANIFGHIYATVYEITETGEIVPYLANDYQISEDGTEHTFTLNEGAIWATVNNQPLANPETIDASFGCRVCKATGQLQQRFMILIAVDEINSPHLSLEIVGDLGDDTGGQEGQVRCAAHHLVHSPLARFDPVLGSRLLTGLLQRSTSCGRGLALPSCAGCCDMVALPALPTRRCR